MCIYIYLYRIEYIYIYIYIQIAIYIYTRLTSFNYVYVYNCMWSRTATKHLFMPCENGLWFSLARYPQIHWFSIIFPTLPFRGPRFSFLCHGKKIKWNCIPILGVINSLRSEGYQFPILCHMNPLNHSCHSWWNDPWAPEASWKGTQRCSQDWWHGKTHHPPATPSAEKPRLQAG